VVPVVETARLRLRASQASDLAAHAAMLGDAEAVRFVGGQVMSREESWRKLLVGPGLWLLLGFGYWAVEEKATGAYLGQIGFADFKRDMAPSVEGLPEMGWMLAPQVQGRGYATEAVLGALAWADGGGLAWHEIVAIIDAANLASIRVAEKAGFALRETATYKDAQVLLFRRRR
jgi:RimJ/RimL family protein N-acetyltransferase